MPSFPDLRASSTRRIRSVVDAHYDVLWRFLRRLGVEERDVEDAAQAVLVIFAQRVATIDVGAERSFLLGSALRVASDARRKRARSREDATDDIDGAIDSRVELVPNAEEQLAERQLRRWLDQVLDTLPDDLRAVFVLVDMEEQTMAEAAAVLAIPPGTVASRLSRARQLFERNATDLKSRIDGGAS